MRLVGVRKHAYGWFLLAVLALAILATALSDISGPLPDVALGSSLLLHVERVLAILLATYIVFVIVIRSWRGELASKLSKDSIEFPTQALDDAEAAAESVLSAEPDPAETQPDKSRVESVIALRLELEAKMTYIAKHLLSGEDCCVTYLTIGSLSQDGYLTDEEARTASWVLTLRDEELDTLPTALHEEFLRNAGKVVGSLRASVFYNLVRKMLEANGWQVEPIPTTRKRADLHATKGEEQFRIVPRFAMKKSSSILKWEKKRLAKYAGERSKRGPTILVVPDRSNSETNLDSDPAIAKLFQLQKKLKLENDPRAAD